MKQLETSCKAVPVETGKAAELKETEFDIIAESGDMCYTIEKSKGMIISIKKGGKELLSEIDIEALINYIADYVKVGSLNTYDIQNAGNLFFYFFLV